MPEDLNIRITSKSDNKGLTDATKAGNELTGSNKKTAESAKDVSKAFEEQARQIPGLTGALNLLKNPLTWLISGFGSLVLGLKKAISEFATAEEKVGRLDAALARVGLLTDDYRESLHDLASQMQETTGVADDQWFDVIRKLTQFGAKGGDMGSLVDGVKNLAGVMDSDLSTAADLVGRALQGNYEVFSRYGIQAKNITELMQELSVKGAGQLEAKAKTLTGSWQNLKNQTNDLLEGIGGMINRTGVLKTSIDFLSGGFQWWVEKIGDVQDRLPGLTNAIDGSEAAMKAATAATKGFADENEKLDKYLTSITDNLKKQNEELDKRKSREEKLADKAKKHELQKIDSSGLSPLEKEGAKLEVETRYANQSVNRDNATILMKAEKERQALQAQENIAQGLRESEASLKQQLEEQTKQDAVNLTIKNQKTLELERIKKAQIIIRNMEAVDKYTTDPAIGIVNPVVGLAAQNISTLSKAKAVADARSIGMNLSDLDPALLRKREGQLQADLDRSNSKITTTAQTRTQLTEVQARLVESGKTLPGAREAFITMQDDAVRQGRFDQAGSTLDQMTRLEASKGTVRGIREKIGADIKAGTENDLGNQAMKDLETYFETANEFMLQLGKQSRAATAELQKQLNNNRNGS